MRRFRLGVLVATLALAACAVSAASSAVAGVGTIKVCNAAGNPPVSTVIVFQLVAPAGAGGTQVATLATGGCSAAYFIATGVQLTVIENVPTGDAVTNISMVGQSTINQTSLAGGVATITMGDSDSTLTFTTRGPGQPEARGCVVPQVIGLTLAAARTAIRHAACRVKTVTYIHSKRIPKGGVTSSSPRHGARLAHNAGVRLYVSRG